MHHHPAGPPLSARVRTGRWLLAAVLTTAVTALVLAVPVLSGNGAGSPTVALESSSSTPAAPDTAAPRSVEAEVEAEVEVEGEVEVEVEVPASTVPGTTGAAPVPTEAPVDTPAPAPRSPAGAPDQPAAGSPEASPGTTTSSSPEPAAPAPPAPVAAPEAMDGAAVVLTRLDEARAEAGCDPLAEDAALTDAARAHSATMREQGVLGLLDSAGHSVLGLARAASVARGVPSAAGAVADWLADPAQAAAITDCTLTSAGIGRVGGPGGPWWTLLLA